MRCLCLATVLLCAGGTLHAQETESPGPSAAPSPLIRISAPNAPTVVNAWEGAGALTETLGKLRDQSGIRVDFLGGIYELEQSITLSRMHGVEITGNSTSQLVFHRGTDELGHTLHPLKLGDVQVRVTHPDRLQPLKRYQLFAPGGKGDRLLEFVTRSIEGDLVTLAWPVQFMPHVTAIPAESILVEDINFFVVDRTADLEIRNLRMDGRSRGTIRGHTTFCGVYAIGDYEIGRRPITKGMTIRGCSFENLSGRGVAFYGMQDVVIEQCTFRNIRAQAIEIDHFSQGLIRHNWVDQAEVGVMINDAFGSTVEGNWLQNCHQGVKFLMIFPHAWVNTGNLVQDNRIGPGCRAGIMFFGPGMKANHIRRNRYFGLGGAYWVMNPDGNRVEDAPPKASDQGSD